MEKSSAFVATFFACFMLVCMGGNGAKEILEEIPHLSKLRQIRSDLERIRTDIERIVQDKKGAQLEAASGLFKDINHLIRRLHELTGRPATGKEGFEFPDPDLPDAEEKKQEEYQDLIARPEPKDERKELQVRLAKVEADQTQFKRLYTFKKEKNFKTHNLERERLQLRFEPEIDRTKKESVQWLAQARISLQREFERRKEQENKRYKREVDNKGNKPWIPIFQDHQRRLRIIGEQHQERLKSLKQRALEQWQRIENDYNDRLEKLDKAEKAYDLRLEKYYDKHKTRLGLERLNINARLDQLQTPKKDE